MEEEKKGSSDSNYGSEQPNVKKDPAKEVVKGTNDRDVENESVMQMLEIHGM